MKEYLDVLKKYAVFEGRARRKEYWTFVLFNVIIGFALGFIEALLGIPPVISALYSLAVVIPGIAVTARRLHDIGKSGWFILITLIPCIGTIWLLILTASEGHPGENQYGPNPKNA
jgi:uncharacterized membrane protein YhaH (DUF805 family)